LKLIVTVLHPKSGNIFKVAFHVGFMIWIFPLAETFENGELECFEAFVLSVRPMNLTVCNSLIENTLFFHIYGFSISLF